MGKRGNAVVGVRTAMVELCVCSVCKFFVGKVGLRTAVRVRAAARVRTTGVARGWGSSEREMGFGWGRRRSWRQELCGVRDSCDGDVAVCMRGGGWGLSVARGREWQYARRITVSLFSFICFPMSDLSLLLREERRSARGSLDQNVATSTSAFSSPYLVPLLCMGSECMGYCKVKNTKRVLSVICWRFAFCL
ncbi:hypothetical protein E2542_SST17605 [Spatholobus suberectus]|nr:hypothetical protein E2542_SST17605 [Spatholobus suberectus]